MSNWDVTRTFILQKTLDQDQAVICEQKISRAEGVHGARISADRKRMMVDYDARKTDFAALKMLLVEAGCDLSDIVWHRLRVALLQYSDRNIRDNAKSPPPACCNKPPK